MFLVLPSSDEKEVVMENHYKFEESKDVITPALVYYLDIIKENRGATRRNTQELRLLFEKHQIIP